MKKIAAILAGGVGKRLNSELPKQFMLLAGKPMIVYSLEAFQHHSAIDEIALVVPSDYVNKCEIYKKDFLSSLILLQEGRNVIFLRLPYSILIKTIRKTL